jgi:uncharacterized membrane protein YphA (DoxX/SURF4 family)
MILFKLFFKRVSFMKKVTLAVRILFGFILFASGVSYFFVTPPPLEGPMADFMKGLDASRYFLYLLKGTEILGGLLLLSGRFIPLALVVLAPVILNIFLVHAFLAPEFLPLGIALGAMQVYLSFYAAEYSPAVKALFRAK